jgi:hypothetical protein
VKVGGNKPTPEATLHDFVAAVDLATLEKLTRQ